MSLSGRVKDGAAKALLQKQLGGLGANIGEFMDLKTGAIKAKKPKKEKPPEQEAIAELKKVEKKRLGSISVYQKNLGQCRGRKHTLRVPKTTGPTH